MPIICEKCGKQAFFGHYELLPDNTIKPKRKFCKDHSNGAEYLNVKQCIDDKCKIIPTLGYVSNKPIACIAHSKSDMKNVTTKKCVVCQVKQPSYNFENLTPKYCFDCKLDKMTNTKRRFINAKRIKIDLENNTKIENTLITDNTDTIV